jgi:signal transduction histidine kinase
MSGRFARLRIGLLVAGLALLIGLGLLVRGALDAAAREQALRREALAARVFDELEASLSSFVAAEEARPFVQWRREWLAPAGGSSLSRSPLAAPPSQPFVVGYFQIEPDGRFASPMAPGPGEPSASPELAARIERMRELSRDLAHAPRLALADLDASEPEPDLAQQQPQQQQQRQEALPEDVQIQRALDQQAIARQRKQVAAQQQAFAPDLDQLSNFLEPDGKGELAAPARATGDVLDVRVTRFAVEPEGGALRMVRSVEIGEQRWAQGLILDRDALETWLEQEVLGSPELAALVELDWDQPSRGAALTDPEAGRWTHEFAAPFAGLEVSAELGAVRVLDSNGARAILLLGLALALALVITLIVLDRSVVALLRQAEERERFVAAVTHELRTPLTSIRMYSEMLEQGMVVEPERQRRYHGTIRGEAERLSRLVEQVLVFARLDQGQATSVAEAERARVDAVVKAVVELLQPQAEARGLSFEIQLSEAASNAQIPRDPLAQILTNVLDNAVKFSPIGGSRVELLGEIESGSLCLCVRDRGPGVEAQYLPKIFEAFVRGRREHERAVPGTGIGLAVVATLVDELGGRVVAHNRAGGGLEIEMVIPLAGAR